MCRVIVMGACPHDDHAQSSNWGIFNQHIWGDYNQHSQQAVLCAVELALEDGVATKTHVLNTLHRLIDAKRTVVLRIVMGACPHDDHAQSSNWGIFNQHIWGDYNQHSHGSVLPSVR
ncbi:hypothetical protein KRIGEM_03087 (plasmid) [Komagataeibacter rhaeticus]|nr:hypothetical protein KRIGEM_03087 [Komagataeibacter rhaeticus]